MTDNEQRLRQISELCEGQAADRRKSVAEIMAEQIIVRDGEIARLVAERDALLAFLREAEQVGSVRDPDYQEQFIERHAAWLTRADAVLGAADATDEDVRWWNQFDADYEALRNDPVAWEEEQGERTLLENTLMDGLRDE